MYGSGRMCLEGRITSFLGEGSYVNGVAMSFGDEFNFRFTEEAVSPIDPEEWHDWLVSVSVGDVVEFECDIDGLRQPRKGYTFTPGTPVLADCVLVDADGAALLPTSTPDRLGHPSRRRPPVPV